MTDTLTLGALASLGEGRLGFLLCALVLWAEIRALPRIEALTAGLRADVAAVKADSLAIRAKLAAAILAAAVLLLGACACPDSRPLGRALRGPIRDLRALTAPVDSRDAALVERAWESLDRAAGALEGGR